MTTTQDGVATARDAESVLRADPLLRRIAVCHGQPDPFCWDDGGRTGSSNFAALVLHIAGQQISTAVAFVLFDRMALAIGAIPDPLSVVSLGTARLRSFGFSRAKASYLTGLAEMQIAGDVDVEHLDHLGDEQAVSALTAVRGIGPWSAEMFLIHQLHRPDVLPAGDLGIRRSIETSWGLTALPSIDGVREQGLDWSPYRSYAAALRWASRRPVSPNRTEREVL